MKSLSALLASLALLAGSTALAQSAGSKAPAHRGPPPELNSDGTITLPDGTILTPPTVNSDGTITLPDGTVLQPPPVRVPPVKNSDGSITLPDGTVVTPNEDGTITLPNGDTIDPSKAPARGPRGAKPSSQSGG